MSCKNSTKICNSAAKNVGGQAISGHTFSYKASLEENTGPYKNGIEISFDQAPPKTVLDMLKENGFRFHGKRRLWYAVSSPERMDIANKVIVQGISSLPLAVIETADEIEETKTEVLAEPDIVDEPKSLKIALDSPKEFKRAENLAPLSYRFRLPEGNKDKRIKGEVEKAFSIVEEVHDIDYMCGSIPVDFISASNSATARLAIRITDGKPLKMQVSRSTDLSPMDVVHEVGHYIDHSMTLIDPLWVGKKENVLNRIRESEAYKFYRNFDRTKVVPRKVTDENGVETIEHITLDEADPGFSMRKYLMRNNELIARAYTQYIAWKTGKEREYFDTYTKFSKSVRRTKRGTITKYEFPMQWEWDDFEPIAQEFDRVFGGMGWLNK